MKDHGFIATDWAVLSGSLYKRSGKVLFCRKESAHFSFPFCLLLLPSHHGTPGSLSFSFKNKYIISIYFDIVSLHSPFEVNSGALVRPGELLVAGVLRLYFNGLASRSPPQMPIHWRTTKRLQSPNLVGLVKLSEQGLERVNRNGLANLGRSWQIFSQ
jgi:hypothetical protein